MPPRWLCQANVVLAGPNTPPGLIGNAKQQLIKDNMVSCAKRCAIISFRHDTTQHFSFHLLGHKTRADSWNQYGRTTREYS